MDWLRNELEYSQTCLVFIRISLSRYRDHSNSAGSAAISLFGNGNFVDVGSRKDYFERIRNIIATHRCGGIINAPMWLSPIVKQTGITFLLGTTGTETNKVEIGSRINENLQICILHSTIQVLGTAFL